MICLFLFCIWDSIVFIVMLLVFVFRIKGFVKFGCVNIGVLISLLCKILNVFWYFFDYVNLLFFWVKVWSGLVMVVKLWINFL